MIGSSCRALSLIALFALFLTGGAEAAKTRGALPEPSGDTVLTAPLTLERAAIEKRLALVAAAELTPAQREWTSSTLVKTLEALTQLASLDAEISSFENQVKTATTQTLLLRQRIEQLTHEPPREVPTTASSSFLVTFIAQAEAEVAQRQKALADIQAERDHRQKRLSEIPQEIAALKQELERLDKGEVVPPAPEGPSWEPLRQVAVEAMRRLNEKKLSRLEAERAALEAKREHHDLQEEEAQLLLSRATEHLKALQAALTVARQREAQEAVEQARRALWETANSHPLIKALAAENEYLARRRTGPQGTTARVQQINQDLDNLRALQEQVRKSYESLRKRLELLGRTPAMGQVMRKERDSLPDQREIARNLRAYSDEMAKVQAELLDLRDKQAQLTILDHKLRSILQREMRLSSDQTSAVVQSLMTQRRALLSALVTELDDLFAKLAEATTLASLVQKDTQEFARFLDERILWVRSSAPYTPAELARVGQAFTTLASRDNLASVVMALRRDVGNEPLLYIALGILLAAVLHWKKCAFTSLFSLRQKSLTLGQTLRYTFFLIADVLTPSPLVLTYLGLRLREVALESRYLEGVGNGLTFAAVFLILRRLARWIDKVARHDQYHFLWRQLRHGLSLLAFLGAATVFVIQVAEAALPVLSADSVERTVFVGAMLALSLFGVRLGATLIRHSPKGHPDSPAKTLLQWSLAGALTSAGLGVVLAVLSSMGFHYSATQILIRALRSLVLIVGSYGIWWLVQRWLIHFARTHGALESVPGPTQRGGTRQETRGAGELASPATYLAQSRRLVSVLLAIIVAGLLWLVWVDVLPALALIARIPLWRKGEVAAGAATVCVTLGDLFLALLVVGLTFAFVRNVPGLIELIFLRRTHVEKGTRYAIAALVRYAVIMVGLIESSHLLGLTWKSVQWMAAAITVGLGFGLQEIFANFVSGLILLFERPVRVGDWITVAGTTGVVTDIRTRATIIRDPDGKDLLIPNKQLITASVMNWTLSGPGTRLAFDVRTDLSAKDDEVRRVLLEVAKSDARVARTPAPFVLMEGITTTEQRYRLYVYCNAIEDRLTLKDRLMNSIQESFAARGITMTFLECALW